MKIADLNAPVTAMKLDWVAATKWMGFTPRGDDTWSRNQCTRSVLKQYGRGYVLEYITVSLQKPNAGFEDDPRYLEDKKVHAENAGRFVAVHRLKTSSRPLIDILGSDEYERIQNTWALDGKRFRWSVAFPIVETYRIVDKPIAKKLLGDDLYEEFVKQTALLRNLDDRVRACLADLAIEKVEATNEWIAIEDEILSAERSDINSRTENYINQDLSGALEGETEERKRKLRRRAAWLADGFVRMRTQRGTLVCDDCRFDPITVIPANVRPRSLLDVHHKVPLLEGKRRTTYDDFSLLCPTCHRLEHLRLKSRENGSQ